MERNRLTRLIHVARRELQMPDDEYRALLQSNFQVKSSTDLTDQQLHALIRHLKVCGFKVKSKAGSRPMDQSGQAKLCRKLWIQLHQAGAVRDSSEAALASFASRYTSVDALQWSDSTHLSKVIEHLKKWQRRAAQQQAAQAVLTSS